MRRYQRLHVGSVDRTQQHEEDRDEQRHRLVRSAICDHGRYGEASQPEEHQERGEVRGVETLGDAELR